ncbi:hypothetical protein E4U55_002427 [Claviceps digitariae]|nr:hypothetical protein E4U55_002427 [Claviceps digitariae]
MAASSSFVPALQAFRAPSSQAPTPFFQREPIRPFGLAFANIKPIVRVLIRRLPLNTSEQSLRLMVVFSKDLTDVEILPIEKSEDEGFRSALLRFSSMQGALEVKSMLDGRSNISNDAQMIVEILTNSPPTVLQSTREQSTQPPVTSSIGTPALSTPRQPSRFTPFQGFENGVSPTSSGAYPINNDFIRPDASSRYQKLFSPQSPIGNHLDRHRISGKTLISSDFADDEETSNLLKDAVAYAEGGAALQRRATAPHAPIGRMTTNLSLSINRPQGPASLPPYMTPRSPASTLHFSNGHNNGHNYPGRSNLPPVNPADQNPPCNTLYVGNLPIDTSEEELKAMFSKQRGYKRLCFRTKQNGPMCFVEFEDVSFATKALHDLYGHMLHNSVKGGIRLSFSKNPLGVRSGQAPGQASHGSMGHVNGMTTGGFYGFSAHGPPPGLSAPPGLGTSRGYHHPAFMNTGVGRHYNTINGFYGGLSYPFNNSPLYNGVATGPNGPFYHHQPYFSRQMMGR